MQQHIDEMIAEWFKATDDVIQFVTQHTNRSVRAVRAGVNKWRAPEIIVQQLIPRLCGVHDIGVAQNCSPRRKNKNIRI